MSPKRHAQATARARKHLDDLETGPTTRRELGAARDYLNTIANHQNPTGIREAQAGLEALVETMRHRTTHHHPVVVRSITSKGDTS